MAPDPVRSPLGSALSNSHYHGHAFGWIFLLGMGAMNLFRGSIHLFKADGGASSIAGIDLALNGEVILMLFASMGLTQLLMAAVDFAVALRFRALVPWLVGFHLIHQIGAALIVWWWRPLPLPAPGKYGAVALLPVVLLAFFAATRGRDTSTPAPATAEVSA
jgi:hypothetical protein